MTLNEFLQKFNDLCLKLNTGEDQRKDLFFQGVNPHIQSHLLLTQPATYREAVAAAKIRDAIKEDNKTEQLLDKVNKLLERQPPFNSVNSFSHPINTLADPLEPIREIRKLKEKIRLLEHNQGTTFRSPPPRNFRTLRTTDGQVVCQYCNKIGHSARSCWKLYNKPSQPPSRNPRLPQDKFSRFPQFNPRNNYQKPGTNYHNSSKPYFQNKQYIKLDPRTRTQTTVNAIDQNTSEGMLLQGSVLDIPGEILVDTGAHMTILSESYWRSICIKDKS